MSNSFYIRAIDPVFENMPSNGSMLEIFECFENDCKTHQHYKTLEESRKVLREFLKKIDKPISSDKVMYFSESGYYYRIAGDYPTADEIKHFSKFLNLKLEGDFDSKYIETVNENNTVKLVYIMEKRATGNGLNPMVFDNIVKVEEELEKE